MKNGQVYDERSPHWWDKWVNPTTVLALIGGIIWGVQLNMLVLNSAQTDARQDEQIQQLQSQMRTVSDAVIRSNTLMDQVSKRLERMDNRMQRHYEEERAGP